MRGKLTVTLAASFLAMGALAMASLGTSDLAVTLAQDGKPKAALVVPDGELTMSESFAVADLKTYLKKISGAEFPVVTESAYDGEALAVRLGRTAVKTLGKHEADFGAEEWFVAWKDGALLLGGGEEHGPEYAVSHFLEDVLGVHWWNGFEEFVPLQPTIAFPPPSLHGRPAFDFRLNMAPLCSNQDGGLAASRNRVIRRGWLQDGVWVDWEEKGGQSRYFSPDELDFSGVHSLMALIRPSDQVEHPEWFAWRDGKRVLPALTPGWPKTSNSSYALCLSSESLRHVTARRLRDRIDADTARAKQLGVPPPRYYNVEQCDNAEGFCQCPQCAKTREENGSEAGNMIGFVNAIAALLEPAYPEVVFTTLAYQATRKPPKLAKPRHNVMIRLTEEPVNYAHSFDAPENKIYKAELDAWLKICGPKNLGVWSYENVADGVANPFPWSPYLPLPNLRSSQARLKHYADLGLPYYLMQPGGSPFGDMPYLKMWMHSKLIENPATDYDALLATFTDGYFGAAGPYLRRYLAELEAAEAKHPSKVWFYANLTEYKYLTLDFLKEADNIFAQAAAAVAANPTFSRRVATARLPLDRAILYNWPKLALETERRGETPFVDPAAVLARLKTSMEAEIGLRTMADKNGRRLGLDDKASRKHLASELAYLAPLCEKSPPLGPPPGVRQVIDDYPLSMGKDKALRLKLNDGKIAWSIPAFCGESPKTTPATLGGLDSDHYEWIVLGTANVPPIAWLELGQATKIVLREMGLLQFHGLLKRETADTVLLSRIVVTSPAAPPLAGDVKLSEAWQVLAPLGKDSPPPSGAQLLGVPEQALGLAPAAARADDGRLDLANFMGGTAEGKTAWVYIPFTVAAPGKVTLGFGADWWLRAWVDGKPVCDTMATGNGQHPPSAADHLVTLDLAAGQHLAVIRFVSGSASSGLSVGGPSEIRQAWGKQ